MIRKELRKKKKYCKEYWKIENYEQAINDKTNTWICHHRDEIRILPSGMVAIRSVEELVENGRYYDCPPNELIFLTRTEHNKLHSKFKKEESKIKNGLSHKNKAKNTHSIFGEKFFEHYGIHYYENPKLYKKENAYFHAHGKCSWE